jgi:hypothetical protein
VTYTCCALAVALNVDGAADAREAGIAPMRTHALMDDAMASVRFH